MLYFRGHECSDRWALVSWSRKGEAVFDFAYESREAAEQAFDFARREFPDLSAAVVKIERIEEVA